MEISFQECCFLHIEFIDFKNQQISVIYTFYESINIRIYRRLAMASKIPASGISEAIKVNDETYSVVSGDQKNKAIR